MNLRSLKWTKNVKPMVEGWAYQSVEVGSSFRLAWKDNESNASKPPQGDLILLRQKAYVTHLVEILDHEPKRENWRADFNIYREVEVLWVIDWNNRPSFAKANEVFGYRVNLQGGNVMSLKTMPTFKQHWQGCSGLTAFQDHVRARLNLPKSHDNGQEAVLMVRVWYL